MIISDRIFQILKEQNMSQKEFSEKTGISQSTISDWKRKHLNPSSDKIMLICNVLNVTPYMLLSGVENEKYNKLDYVVIDKKTEEYRLIERYRNLEESSRTRLLGYLEALMER